MILIFTVAFHLGACTQNIGSRETSGWAAYGGDAGGMRYVESKQINISNVTKLKTAWVFRTGELETYEGTRAKEKAAFEATPLMINGTLYFSTPSCRVFALDAVNGKEKWTYDPRVNLKNDYSEVTSRGVSSWPGPDMKGIPEKDRRIFIGTIDGRLIALSAQTGKPLEGFGEGGVINLRKGLGADISVTSPPAIIGRLLIIGSSLGDNQRIDYPRGTVRAFDVISGELKWSWDPNPGDESDPAWNTWQGPRAHETGAANAWSLISVDPQRDLVFIPATCPSPDYYGGERKGQNLYGNSLVALRASTGKMVWYFQVVHHDLWDYDIAAQPLLFDLEKEGKHVPAVAVATKMGHVFILHRETGKPLFPVEERPVPASSIPGEETWKTQPFPVLPEPLGMQSISPDDAWGTTPAEKDSAAQRIKKYLHLGIFTPPSLEGSIMTPGNAGGIHWGGMCLDPVHQVLITNYNNFPALIRLFPREELKERLQQDNELLRSETGLQNGTPYIVKRDYLIKRNAGGMIMQVKPPWGNLVAIDLHTGGKKWEVPLGYMLDPRTYPGAENWGSFNFGGALVTAGGLVFVAASMDQHLRAFNSSTGKLLWESGLPAGGQATPMSYEIKGRQYVIIAAGGHGKLGTPQGDYLLAFSL